eukprot:TRINITY_DN9076_c0_g1_i1.p1 TRINITY_DN9076_c0_g1~~TRINITY_DN9076_c0_g1_i1.p1  ORF type:complete len:259 (+),score=71.15 TRINITY_DN9076_c0_g1_i1:205-981(+)
MNGKRQKEKGLPVISPLESPRIVVTPATTNSPNLREKSTPEESRSPTFQNFMKKLNAIDIPMLGINSTPKREEKKEVMPPKSPFDSLEDRVQSFRHKEYTWPHIEPSPEELAAAGFHYAPKVGFVDRCKCHTCGIQIYSWNVDHNPFQEHATRSSECLEVITWSKQVDKMPFMLRSSSSCDFLKKMGVENSKKKQSQENVEVDPHRFAWEECKTESEQIPFWFNSETEEIRWTNPQSIQVIKRFDRNVFISQLDEIST